VKLTELIQKELSIVSLFLENFIKNFGTSNLTNKSNADDIVSSGTRASCKCTNCTRLSELFDEVYAVEESLESQIKGKVRALAEFGIADALMNLIETSLVTNMHIFNQRSFN
jgi:hypothetical protein